MTISRLNEGGYIARNEPMSLVDVERIAPSVFAGEASSVTSEKYEYVPTSKIIRELETEGYGISQVMQANVRKNAEEREGFQKHLVRMRRRENFLDPTSAELLIINAHDATSSYQIKAGVFRLVCSNGMIVGDTFSEVRVRHTGDNVFGEVIDGTYEVIKQADRAVERVRDARNGLRVVRESGYEEELSRNAPLYGADEENPYDGFDPEALLGVRRYGDQGADLWKVFNRVQENTIRGNRYIRAQKTSDTAKDYWGRPAVRRNSLRPIRSVDSQVKVNETLWSEAEKLAA